MTAKAIFSRRVYEYETTRTRGRQPHCCCASCCRSACCSDLRTSRRLKRAPREQFQVSSPTRAAACFRASRSCLPTQSTSACTRCRPMAPVRTASTAARRVHGAIRAQRFRATGNAADSKCSSAAPTTSTRTLKVGNISEAVQVTAENAPLVDTRSTMIAHNVTAEEIDRLPEGTQLPVDRPDRTVGERGRNRRRLPGERRQRRRERVHG